MKHENFVDMLGDRIKRNLRIVSYEFATMGSLHDVLHGRKGFQGARPGPTFGWMQRVQIVVDATKGLDIFIGKLISPLSIGIIEQLISSCLKASRQR